MASHYGYIKINWPKVNRRLERVEREISEYDPSYLKNSVCISNFIENCVSFMQDVSLKHALSELHFLRRGLGFLLQNFLIIQVDIYALKLLKPSHCQ